MATTSDGELYLLDRNNGVLRADFNTKVWRQILKSEYWYDKIFTEGISDLYIYEEHSDSLLHSSDKGNTWETCAINQIKGKITDKTQKNILQDSDKIKGRIIGSCTGNGCVWILTENGYLNKVQNGEVTSYRMTTDLPIKLNCRKRDTTHRDMTYYNGIYYYVYKNHVYCMNESQNQLVKNAEKWYRYLDVDSKINYIWKNKNGVYICDEKFNKFQINQETDAIKPYKSEFVDLKKGVIEKIKIRKGYHSCEGGLSDYTELTYELKNDEFVKTKEEKLGQGYISEAIPQKISKVSVDKLLECVYNAMCGDKDTTCIELTDSDFTDYKRKLNKEIEKLESKHVSEEEEIVYLENDYIEEYEIITLKDLHIWSSILDTLKSTQQMQNVIFSASSDINNDEAELSGDFCVILLGFKDGRWLVLNDNYNYSETHNYLRCPWIAQYDGDPFILKSLAIGKSIDEMTEGKLLQECNSKEHAIKTTIRYLWKSSI